MRISPKMSEKPAASRNSRPPRAEAVQRLNDPVLPQKRGGCPGPVFPPFAYDSRFFAGANRASTPDSSGTPPVVGPELAHVRVGVMTRFTRRPSLRSTLADVHAPDYVAVTVEDTGPRAVSTLMARTAVMNACLSSIFSLDCVQVASSTRPDICRGGIEAGS